MHKINIFFWILIGITSLTATTVCKHTKRKRNPSYSCRVTHYFYLQNESLKWNNLRESSCIPDFPAPIPNGHIKHETSRRDTKVTASTQFISPIQRLPRKRQSTVFPRRWLSHNNRHGICTLGEPPLLLFECEKQHVVRSCIYVCHLQPTTTNSLTARGIVPSSSSVGLEMTYIDAPRANIRWVAVKHMRSIRILFRVQFIHKSPARSVVGVIFPCFLFPWRHTPAQSGDDVNRD